MHDATQLRDVIDIDTGFAFKSTGFTEDATGVRLLRGDNVVQGRLRWDGCKRWPVDDSHQFSGYLLQQGDIVIAMDRPWIAAGLKYAVIRSDDVPALLVQRVARLRARAPLEQTYLQWVIASRAFTQHILAMQTGTTVPHISAAQIGGFHIGDPPPLHEQVAIAELLGALDDKIESNGRLHARTQALADVVLGAAAGVKVRLDAIAQITMGSSPPGPTYNDRREGLPFYQGVTDFGLRFPVPRIWCSSPVRIARRDDILISVRAPVGRLNRAVETCCVGRGVAAAACNRPSTLYYALRAAADAWAVYNREGTVYGAINREGLKGVQILWPTDEVGDAAERDLAALDARVEVAERESSILARLRDTLLPALLSGRLRVPDAERAVADAT